MVHPVIRFNSLGFFWYWSCCIGDVGNTWTNHPSILFYSQDIQDIKRRITGQKNLWKYITRNVSEHINSWWGHVATSVCVCSLKGWTVIWRYDFGNLQSSCNMVDYPSAHMSLVKKTDMHDNRNTVVHFHQSGIFVTMLTRSFDQVQLQIDFFPGGCCINTGELLENYTGKKLLLRKF